MSELPIRVEVQETASQVVYTDVQQASSALKSLVSENTK